MLCIEFDKFDNPNKMKQNQVVDGGSLYNKLEDGRGHQLRPTTAWLWIGHQTQMDLPRFDKLLKPCEFGQ